MDTTPSNDIETPMDVSITTEAPMSNSSSTGDAAVVNDVAAAVETKDTNDVDAVEQPIAEAEAEAPAAATPAPEDLPSPTTKSEPTTPTKGDSAASGNAGDLQCVILED